MKLIEKEHCYIIENFFNSCIIAGFTKKSLSGNPPADIPKAISYLNKDFKVAQLKQIHSAKIHLIQEERSYQGDGLFTQKNNLALTVRTADCLPIFLYSNDLDAIGVVHMGWRGAKEGILDNIPYDLSSFKATVGLGLRKCCYAVGQEFLDYPKLSEFLVKRGEKLYFDPVNFVKESLNQKGLKEENFLDLEICNFCSKQNYLSYRKDKTSTRTLSFILKLRSG